MLPRPVKRVIQRREEEGRNPEACYHNWNGDDCSERMDVGASGDMGVVRQQHYGSTDAVRGKQGYSKGIHVWHLWWSQSCRGTHAMIGVATKELELTRPGYVNLLGQDKSFGWNLTTQHLWGPWGCSAGEYPREDWVLRGEAPTGEEFAGYVDGWMRKLRLGDFTAGNRQGDEISQHIKMILDMDRGTLIILFQWEVPRGSP